MLDFKLVCLFVHVESRESKLSINVCTLDSLFA